jgi:hypothetical protein
VKRAGIALVTAAIACIGVLSPSTAYAMSFDPSADLDTSRVEYRYSVQDFPGGLDVVMPDGFTYTCVDFRTTGSECNAEDTILHYEQHELYPTN